MAASPSLASRLVITGVAFLAAALASISFSLWVTWQLEGGAAAVNEAGRLRMLTYRMAFESATGPRGTWALQAAGFERTLQLLQYGDPSRPLAVPASADTAAGLARVQQDWRQFRSQLATHDGNVAALGAPAGAAPAEALVHSVDRFVAAIEQRLADRTAALRSFQLVMVGLAIVGAVLLLYTSHLLVLEPLRRLGAAMAAMRCGRLETRVEAPATAEFRELADGFNAMALRLQGQYAGLAQAVRSKTADLQAQQQRLAALYEVTAAVAAAETLDEMARGFVRQVRRITHADAIALRWSDAGNQRYLMLAHEGLPPDFAADEQCLHTGDCHCGQAQPTARSRVIAIRPDPQTADTTRGHCSRAGFETLLSVPLTLNHRILGEVDLFFRQPSPPPEADRSLVELMASHLAGGIEGLRATAVEREAAVSNERALLAQELHDSIAQSLAFLKIQVQLLRGALARGESGAVDNAVAEIEAGVLESYGDVRELLVHFRTRADAEDIEPALRTTLRKFQLQTGVTAEITLAGHGVALPNDVQVQVLHILQEALSNVRKHARATAVRLHVQQTPNWRFEVHDDGVGFDHAAQADDSHVGLRIMAERAARIGARLGVFSQPGGGTSVTLSLPAAAEAPGERAPTLHDSPGAADTDVHADSLAGG